MADLDHAAQTGQGFLVDLLMGDQFGVIEAVAQEPAELPHCFRCAIEATDDGMTGKFLGFEDGEAERVKGLLGVPAKLGAVDANEQDAVGDLRPGKSASDERQGHAAYI